MHASTRTVVVLVAAWLAVHASTGAQVRDAAQVLAAAREALGGESNLSGIKTFVAAGRTRQLRGNNLVPIEFEINCELPDNYVRKDEFPSQDTDLSVAGFRGGELIAYPPPPAGRGGPPPAQRLLSVKQDFARLMLGVFAASLPAFPLTFKYAAEGDAPEGKADVLDVAGPANFTARLVVQRETHLPVMVMWQPPPPPTPPARAGGPPAAAAPTPPARAGGLPAAGAPTPAATPQESRLYFADYRTVSGIKWPFRIRRAVAGNTIEETTFDRVSVNVKIDPRKFKAPK